MKTRHGLEIRAATAADSAGLSELLGSAGQAISARVLADRLDAVRRGSGAVLLAMTWGPPIGLIVTHWYQTLEADQPTAQITTLFVEADERRRGIGRLLIKAAAQAARTAGCGALEIVVPPPTQDLSAFCRATGFIEGGLRFIRPLRKRTSQD